MKKRALSSWKSNKTRTKFKKNAPAVKRKRTAKKASASALQSLKINPVRNPRRVLRSSPERSLTKNRAPQGAEQSIISNETKLPTAITAVKTAPTAPLTANEEAKQAEERAVYNRASAIQPITPARPGIIVESPRPGIVDFRIINPPPPVDQQRAKLLMWTGVMISMILIIGGWAWTLRYSFSAKSQELNSGLWPINQADENLTELFEQVSQSLDDLQKQPLPAADAPPSNQFLNNALDAEEIELLKRKIEEQAKNQPAAEPTAPALNNSQ